MSKTIEISIVFPAYNEAERLPLYLERLIFYCNNSKKTYEIIIVDDGSRDNTIESIESYKKQFNNLHTIRYDNNRGKGYAVKKGLFESSGEICVFLDADGSVPPEEIEKNLHYIVEEGYDIFAGSRVPQNKDQVLRIKWYRKLIGKIFNFFVHIFLFENIKDTQCGFKMFKKEIVEPLFSRCHLEGFGFDVEVLYLAYKMGYRIKEGPVSWHHVDGTKLNLFTDSVKMFFNILQVRNWHCTPINIFSKYLGPDEYKYMYKMEKYHWWFVCRRNLVVHLMKSLKIPSPVILDVGAGTGGNLLAFRDLGTVFGIDASEQSIGFCRKRGLENVILCSAENIRHKDKIFDIVTCLDLLEHVPNPVETLLELKRVLKDNGKIIITAAAFKILWSQHDEALCHLRRYEKTSLSKDIREAGLKIDRMGYFFFASFFVVAPIRIIRRFFLSRYKLVSDTSTLPPKALNAFLRFFFNLELKAMGRSGAPFGTTIYAVISK